MSHASAPAALDIRALAPRERHPLIFSTFSQLRAGQAMELINDHDPQPLHHQFQAEWPASSAGLTWNRDRRPGAWPSPDWHPLTATANAAAPAAAPDPL